MHAPHRHARSARWPSRPPSHYRKKATSMRAVVASCGNARRRVTGTRVTIAAARASDLHHSAGARIFATYHPAAVLRAPDDDAKETLMGALIDDLKRAAALASRVE